MTLVVLNVVGLTPRLLPHMPAVRSVADQGFSATLETVFPAVTCSVQSSMLTGLLPRDHGIVGNGWYFRDLGEVFLWRQHNALVQGSKVWDELSGTVANVCWWYAMGARVDWTVTPRPIYYADGRKEPDCYTHPAELHDDLVSRIGDFPLFTYWGPTASIASSRWIIAAAGRMLQRHTPDLLLVYVPHLDYDLQRFGPDGDAAVSAAVEVDTALRPLIELCRERGDQMLVVSEYGITGVSRPVDVNRALRRAGLLHVHVQDGMEYLDPWTSRAFAVADHQVAHVYVRDPADLERTRSVLAELPGVDLVLDAETKPAFGIDHERAGDLVAVAEPDSWFTYYYWLDDARAPDFARAVEIHRKPGYDPAELLFAPGGKLRAAKALLRKKTGMRYLMDVVPLDPSGVRGSHGRLPDTAADSPVLLCSDPSVAAEKYAATDVKQLILRLRQAS